MKKVHFKKLTALVLTLAMLFSLVGTISVLAEREYAAELSINGAIVDFKNEPYSKFNTVFVPLEELCGYIGIDITRNGNTYTIKRMRDTLTMDVENIVININGKTVLLENGLTERNGVVYAPVEIFSEGFKCPVTLSDDFRSADIQPNVYSVVINQDNAAAISAALPDNDTLVVSSDGADQLFYKPEESPEKEIAVFYKADLSDFADKKIATASLNLHVARGSNLHQTIDVQRTKPWSKGELNFTNQPAFYEGQRVSASLPTELKQSAKNWADMQFNITSLVNSAIGDGETLSVKLLGVPFKNQANPGTPQAHVKGVNTTTAPYIAITVSESYTFPVKKVETAGREESRFDEFQILRSLGVFTAEDEFPLDLKESVTRGEFLTYAMRLRGNNIPVGASEQFFSDVPTDNGYFAVTSSAYELGYIAGWQGIAFRPYDAITVGEAVTILGRMLNYDVYADERGGFTPGYFQAAAHGDLYVGVNDSITQLSFKQMFRLLEDALDAKMLNVYSYSSNGSAQYTFDENMTILTEFWNAEKIEGQITANEYSNIVPGGACSEGYITITTGTGATKTLRLNYEPYNSLLGFKVKGYYEKHENVLLYIGTIDADVDEYSYRDIESFNIGASDISFSYKKGNGSLKTESFSKSANVIYNGKSVDASKLELKHLDTGCGKITIVGNDLVIIEAYRSVVVGTVNVEEETIYDLYEKYKNLIYMKNKDWQITDAEDREIKLEDLKKYDVISVAESFDKELYKGILSRKTVEGKIEMLESSGADGEILTINGFEYTTINTTSGDWKKYLTLNSKGTFLLNHEGVIVGMSVTPNEEVLGYVVAMDYSGGSSLRKNLQAALMVTGSEKYVVYDLASSVKIDGKKYTKHEDIKKNTQLFPNGENNPVKMQGIIFSLNNEGKINVIDTVARPENIDREETTLFAAHTPTKGAAEFNALPNKSEKRKVGGLDYKSSTPGKIADKFFLNLGEALCVVIPTQSDNITPVTDFEKFMTITSGIGNDDVINPTVYTVGNKTPNASIVILEGYNPGAEPEGYYLVVDRIVTAFDEDGTEIQKIYYYSAPDKRESVVVPYDAVAKLTGDTVIDGSIKRGDIIRIGTDARGELSAVTEYFDYNKKIFGNLSTSFSAQTRLYGGISTEIYDEFAKINLNSDIYPAAAESEDFWLNTKENFNFYKYTVSSAGVEVLPATIADVRPSENAPDSPTGFLLQASYASLANRTVFLLEMNQPANSGIYELSYEPNLPTGADAQTLVGFPIASTRYNPGETAQAALKGSISVKDYDFVGWINKATGEEVAPGGEVVINDNTVLQAKWSPNLSIELTFEYEGMSFATYPSQYVAGTNTPSELTFPTNADAKAKGLVRPGYEIIGWKAVGGTDEYMLHDKTPDEYTVPSIPTTYEPIWMGNWTGEASASLATETIDTKTYYQIYSGEDLAKFAQLVNGGEVTANAILMNDIYLNNFLDEEGKPISMTGWYNNSDNVSGAKAWDSFVMTTYSGIFDGNGKSIYGLYIAPSSTQGTYTGMFKQISGATIKNLKLQETYMIANATAHKSKYTGVLVGGIGGTNNLIDNVDIIGGKVRAKEGSTQYMPAFGTIAGTIAGKTDVKNCDVSITVDASDAGKTFTDATTNSGIGGLVGRANASSANVITIDACGFTGHFNVAGTSKVGAIIGTGADNSARGAYLTIKNCSGSSTASAATTLGSDLICGNYNNYTSSGNNVSCTK